MRLMLAPLLFLILAAACPADGARLPLDRIDRQGTARVIDGDTLALGALRIRLSGIDAAEMNTAAGRAAKSALVNIVQGRAVACRAFDTDRYGRTVARCTLPDDTDLGISLILAGQARPWPHFLRHLPHERAYLEAGLAFGACRIGE